jgi:hypothetical protein
MKTFVIVDWKATDIKLDAIDLDAIKIKLPPPPPMSWDTN